MQTQRQGCDTNSAHKEEVHRASIDRLREELLVAISVVSLKNKIKHEISFSVTQTQHVHRFDARALGAQQVHGSAVTAS